MFRTPATRVLPAALLATALAAVAACSAPVGSVRPTATGPGPTRPAPTAPAATATPAAPTQPDERTQAPAPGSATEPEPGAIKGRVTTEDGRPVEGAEIHLTGYTAQAGRQHDEDLVSGADGAYRAEVPDGLYEVSAEALLDWEGEMFRLALTPADGACEEEVSAEGIVEDWILRLSGPTPCITAPDPNNAGFYLGATVYLYEDFAGSHPADAEIELTFVPDGPLADGSAGQTLTMTRTVGALTTFSGPLDQTYMLYDIPLGRYRVTAQLDAGAGAVDLDLATEQRSTPAPEVVLTFQAAQFFTHGIRSQNLTVSD